VIRSQGAQIDADLHRRVEGTVRDHCGHRLVDQERVVTITGIISAIIIGLVIGALGRLVVPGRQPIPIWLTIVIGIVAAFIGAFIAGALGYANANGGIPWVLLIIQIIIAAIGVVIAANLYARRGGARP
jgi:uncharacterized membrane protein YeaQ/YmgE (transglycosylase-associated protein family)